MKISKFRKWLIKKLGGITPDEKITPIMLSESHRKIETIEASLILSKRQADEYREYIQPILERDIFNQLMGKINIYTVDMPNVCEIKYVAKLNVVKE